MIDSHNIEASKVTFYSADYGLLHDFKEQVNQAVMEQGDITLCITWMRSNALPSFRWIQAFLLKQQTTGVLYEIKGSSASKESFKASKISYSFRRITLGFELNQGHSRWLTNDEISDGVLEAIQLQKTIYTIGQTEPWEKRSSY